MAKDKGEIEYFLERVKQLKEDLVTWTEYVGRSEVEQKVKNQQL